MTQPPSGAGADPGVPHLEACPFCGGQAAIVEVTEPSNVGGYVVQCNDCEASTRVWFPIKDDVTGILHDAWNKRAPVAARLAGSPERASEHIGRAFLEAWDKQRTEAEAPGDGRGNESACINCGEAHDGGYLSGRDGDINEGAVGPFCSQCWEFLHKTFQPIEAGDGRAARLQALVARLETYYDFECDGGMLGKCVEWQELKAIVLARQPEGK